MYKWSKRVGLETIRTQIVDDEPRRKALYERFVISQKTSQVDPWAERVAGKEAYEFNPLKLKSAEAAE